MSIDVLMPALSPTMEEGTLAKWHVKQGDQVRSGDVIAEIETDKATMEVEAVDEGTVEAILVAEGSEGVKVNTPSARLSGEGEAAAPAPAVPPPQSAAAQPTAFQEGEQKEAARPEAPAPPQAPAQPQPEPTAPDGQRIFASPLARRIAAQKGIDLAGLKGSGPHGRIV